MTKQALCRFIIGFFYGMFTFGLAQCLFETLIILLSPVSLPLLFIPGLYREENADEIKWRESYLGFGRRIGYAILLVGVIIFYSLFSLMFATSLSPLLLVSSVILGLSFGLSVCLLSYAQGLTFVLARLISTAIRYGEEFKESGYVWSAPYRDLCHVFFGGFDVLVLGQEQKLEYHGHAYIFSRKDNEIKLNGKAVYFPKDLRGFLRSIGTNNIVSLSQKQVDECLLALSVPGAREKMAALKIERSNNQAAIWMALSVEAQCSRALANSTPSTIPSVCPVTEDSFGSPAAPSDDAASTNGSMAVLQADSSASNKENRPSVELGKQIEVLLPEIVLFAGLNNGLSVFQKGGSEKSVFRIYSDKLSFSGGQGLVKNDEGPQQSRAISH